MLKVVYIKLISTSYKCLSVSVCVCTYYVYIYIYIYIYIYNSFVILNMIIVHYSRRRWHSATPASGTPAAAIIIIIVIISTLVIIIILIIITVFIVIIFIIIIIIIIVSGLPAFWGTSPLRNEILIDWKGTNGVSTNEHILVMIMNDVIIRKGTNGVSTNEVTANFSFFDRGTFWGTPVNVLLSSSQKCQCVPFLPICRDSLLLQRPH